jgi:hypothetical protein
MVPLPGQIARPGKNNELSAHCLRVSAAKINKEMETLLVEGYRAAAKESRALTKRSGCFDSFLAWSYPMKAAVILPMPGKAPQNDPNRLALKMVPPVENLKVYDKIEQSI